jgi:hypothetical protein
MKKLYLFLVLSLLYIQAFAQTLMPLPVHASLYTGSARGYWFTAPCNFTITGLRVPIEAGTGPQYIHVMKCNDPLPIAFTAQSSNFNTLIYINGATNNVIQTVNIPVNTGDVIGILGTNGTGNSYATGGFSTNINGFPVILTRFGYQGNINTGPAPQYWGEALNATSQISRVEMYYTVGPPCPIVTGLNATSILSTSATVGWNAVAGSIGYDYIVDQNANYSTGTLTTITGTSAPVTGLLPGNTYYLHVRNKCSGGGISQWSDYMFTTLPPCNDPTGFHTTNLQSTSTTINWDPLASALSWDYVIDQNRADPTSSTGATNVTSPTDNVTGLTENTWYYVHIRANCTGEQSNWSLDSFLTSVPCRAPEVKISNINVDEAVAYWEAVNTAVRYEYAITTSATPPANGTMYDFLSIHTSALRDGKDYYIHVRSHCLSFGVSSVSPWATASFKTFPTSVGTAKGDAFGVQAYPNPAGKLISIEVSSVTGNVQASITNLAGEVVRQVNITSRKTEVDISSLPAGVYMLKYADEAHNSIIKINKL